MKLLQHLGVGLSIGFVLTTAFSVTFMGLNEFTAQVLAWFIASALYGVSSMIFKIRSIKYLYISIIHYLICLGITGVNVYLFYQDYLISVLISFSISYFIIYIIMWLIEKHNLALINKKLSSR